MIRGIIAVMFLLMSCDHEEGINTLKIVSDGKSNYEIVLSDNSNYESALILQDYLKKMSGITLPIISSEKMEKSKHKIYVATSKKHTKTHEISLETIGKDIYISGGSKRYTKYAVYDFLDRQLGCKWLAPNVEQIPKVQTITLNPTTYYYSPRIETRTVHSRLFYDNPRFANQQKVTHTAFPNYVPEARVHTFEKFVPEKFYYGSHPEYYALRNGKRLPTQLCLTNKDVLQLVKDSVAILFKKYPKSKVISVSQNDNQQYCQCEACSKINMKEGSPSGAMIRFVNKIASYFPKKTFSTLAYQYTRTPCKTKPAKNVLITLCSIECDRSNPISETCKDFAKDLKGWGNISDNIRIWDYTTQFTNFLAPFPNFHTLQPNLELFVNNKANWVFEQHSNQPSELFELRSYLMAKLLWNPNADIDKLITEFTNAYYKEAGIYVKRYIDLMSSELKKNDDFFLFLYGDPSEAFSLYLSERLLKTYSNLFDTAEKVIAENSEVIARLKKARLGIDFAILETCRKNNSKDFNLVIKNKAGLLALNPSTQQRLESFKAVCKVNNITLMNEMGLTVEEYCRRFLHDLQLAKIPNKAFHKKVRTITKPKKYANENPETLTDGAFGGYSFYANWLGYEGHDMEVVLDLGKPENISFISMAFLQVTNHIVFFPKTVTYYGALDTIGYINLGKIANKYPLQRTSKVNDIQRFDLNIKPQTVRYIKIRAENTKTPYWHHATGLPSWIFSDEIIAN